MSILKQAQIVKLASQVAHETDTAHNADNLIHKIRQNTSVNHPMIRSKACRGRSRRKNSLQQQASQLEAGVERQHGWCSWGALVQPSKNRFSILVSTATAPSSTSK